MTRPNEPVPNVLILSKSSRLAVFVGFLRHFSSNSSLACSRNSFTVSAESTFLLDVVALLPMVNCLEKSLLTAPDLLEEVVDDTPENDFEWTFCCCLVVVLDDDDNVVVFDEDDVAAEDAAAVDDEDEESKLKIEGLVEEEVSERFFVSFKASSFS